MAAATASFPTPLPNATARREICREMESTPRTLLRHGGVKNYKLQKTPLLRGVSQWRGGGAGSGPAPAGERGDVIAQRGPRGRAARRRSLCSAAAASAAGAGGGAALPLLRCLRRAALHASPHTAALRRALQLLSRASWPQGGSTAFRRAALRCSARAVGTEHASLSGTASCARARCTHPGELPCAGRVASTHPSGSGLPRTHLRGTHLARRAGAAAPSPAVPSVRRRPGAAASSHRR